MAYVVRSGTLEEAGVNNELRLAFAENDKPAVGPIGYREGIEDVIWKSGNLET
jgi:hypothetical protein